MVKQCDGVSARFRLLHSRSAMPANVGGGGPAPRFLFRSHRSVSAGPQPQISPFTHPRTPPSELAGLGGVAAGRTPQATGHRPLAARRSLLALNSCRGLCSESLYCTGATDTALTARDLPLTSSVYSRRQQTQEEFVLTENPQYIYIFINI